ncbi:MAG TPA: VTT domain-containing protein [Baekduia sp.]
MLNRRWVQAVLALAGVAVLAALCLLVHPLREAIGHAASGDTTALREQLRGTGVAGVLLLYGLMLAHVVVLFPAEITNLTAGFTYGIPLGILICATGWFLSALGTYALGIIAGRPVIEKLAGRARVESAERMMERGGWPFLLVARLLPFVPFSLVGYLAGATRVPLMRFAWTTAVGELPLITLAVVLGSRLQHFSISDPLVWGSLLGFAILIAASHPVGRRWQRGARGARA